MDRGRRPRPPSRASGEGGLFQEIGDRLGKAHDRLMGVGGLARNSPTPETAPPISS